MNDEQLKRIAAKKRRETLAIGLEKLTAKTREKYKLSVLSDWRYRQFFHFLQISPSYDLARRYSGKLQRDAKKRAAGIKPALPSDFATVLATYEAFGDVWKIDFWDWWVQRAQFQFGYSVAPSTRRIALVAGGTESSSEEIKSAAEELSAYLSGVRMQEALPTSLILAIPLYGDRKKILGAITPLIDEAYSSKDVAKGVANYKMIRDKSQEETIKQALAVVRAKASKPNAPLFDIGKKSISTVLANAKPSDYDKRRALMQQTSKYLKRAYFLAENAARGRFPSITPLKYDKARPEINFSTLRTQYAAYIKKMEKKLAAHKEQALKLRSKKGGTSAGP